MAHYNYKLISKDEVTKSFIELAIELFDQDSDNQFLASLNMAGVAEEILGKKIAGRGKVNAQTMEVKTLLSVRQLLNLEPVTEQHLKDNLLNKAKNDIKHKEDDLYLDPKREAEDILERAIRNYQILNGEITDNMEDFLKRKHIEDQKLLTEVLKFKLENTME